jgi:RND family efflux transporter MFP subunit
MESKKMNQQENKENPGEVVSETPVAAPASPAPTNRQWSARKRWLLITALIILVTATALALWLNQRAATNSIAGRPVPEPTGSIVPSPSSEGSAGEAPRPGDILITLSSEKLENAHIKTEAVTVQPGAASAAGGGLRTTGTVEANAYKEVPVLPVAGGIVREVKVALGDRVQRGQPLAVIFSTELSEAQSEYLKMLAEIEKHHQNYRRTAELVEIGAASKQELEEVTAEYKTEQAKVSAAKQRLLLLGVSEMQVEQLSLKNQVKPLISVLSPSSGVILSRTVNSGEVIMMGKELFRVADLSTVWVVGQIYESNFATVRVGTPAVITAPAYPGKSFTGRVSYIDPRVEPQMRTAQVRIEVANPGEMLKLGMFVDLSFGGAAPTASSGQPIVTVPSVAVQMLGAKPVVFVATDQPGVFAQREVSVGAEANGAMPIYSGLTGGEKIVTEGSFLLRAESLKVNPTQPTTSSNQTATQSPATPNQPPQMEAMKKNQERESEPKVQAVTVTLNAKGYQPASFKLKQGLPARVTFVRKVEATCGTEIVIPEYDIKRELPLNEPVTVEFTPNKSGEFTFACGMNMLRGKIVVK